MSVNFIFYFYLFIYLFFLFFQMTHISAIPLELIMYIFKWVVSMELDMKSLDQLARVMAMTKAANAVQM